MGTVVRRRRNAHHEAALDSRPRADVALEDLVFVSEDMAEYLDGCDAVSIFSVTTADPVLRGRTLISPGRIALSRTCPWSFAPASNGDPFLYVLERSPLDASQCRCGSWRAAPRSL